jgi:hypothetical protein
MEKHYKAIFGFWALAFVLITSQVKSQTAGGANGMVFRFTKQVWLNPTIILAKQSFEQSTNVKLLILPRINGDDTTGSSRIEKAFDKLLSFLVYKDNVQGSIKFYFNPKNPTKPFTFNTSDELFCKFTPLQKDSVETILNKDIVNSSNLSNFTALPFDSIISRASRYCKKILQSKPGLCGENPGNEFTLTKINSAPAKLNFDKGTIAGSTAPNGGVDQKKYAELEQYYNTVLDVADNSNYPLAWKAMAANTSDVIKLKLKKKQSYFDISKLVFKNANGSETYNVTYNHMDSDSSIDLSISGKSPGSMAEVVAFYTPTTTPTQTFAIGAFNVQFYEAKPLKVVLVKLGTAELPDVTTVKTMLNSVYGDALINWQVSTATCSLPSTIDKNIHMESSGLLSNYMPDMQPILNHFKDSQAYADNDDNTYYLLFGATNDGNLDGYMPRGRNIGFIFSTSEHTVAHELGHGAFNLKHIFCSEELGEGNKGVTDNIMDYSVGTKLYKYQWDLIHDPAFVSWFGGDDEEGAFQETMLTPDWKPFTFKGSNTWLTQPKQEPNGVVYGVQYNEKSFIWSPTLHAYASGTETLNIVINTNPGSNLMIELYWNTGICGYNELYTAPWDYLQNKMTFDPATVTDSRVNFKKRIPCIAEGADDDTPRPIDKCKDIPLSKINKERTKLEQMNLNWTSQQLADTINSVDVCALWQLDYTKLEPLIKKLGNESSYSTAIEVALVSLLRSVNDDKIDVLYVNVLYPNSFGILKKMIDNLGGDEYTAFMETLGYIGQHVDNDQRKWGIINTLVKQRYSHVKDERETGVFEKTVATMSMYYSDPSQVPALVASFTHLLIDECEPLTDYKVIFDIGAERNSHFEVFAHFTQSDYIKFEVTGWDANQGGELNWVIPEEISMTQGAQSIHVPKQDLWQYYGWSNYLKNHPTTEAMLSSNPAGFFDICLAQAKLYIAAKAQENDDFWANLQLNDCNQLQAAVSHIKSFENTESLRLVDKEKRLSVVRKIFDCESLFNNVSNTTSSLFSGGADVLTKLSTSFDDNDQDILVAFEGIGFQHVCSVLRGERFSNFCVWAGTHAISSGRVKELRTSDALKSTGTLVDAGSLLQLEGNLFQFSNFSAAFISKTQLRTDDANPKTVDYNQMVLVYVTDDFTFLDQEFKKGSVMAVPMIQAYAMSESNRSVVAEKAVWLGVDILSFAVGVGELKVFFTVGNYIRKGIILSDLIGTGAGAVANSLNESAISPQLRYKLQMLSVVASLPMLATSFKNVNKFVENTDAEINALNGLNSTAKTDLGNYFHKISTKLTGTTNSLLTTLSQIKSKLGFLPSSPLNFTGFVAKTSDEYVDIVIHFQNGRYVISKEGALTTELLIDDLAKIINEVPNGKSVRLLSCNDLEAARQLSQLTNKPFYASDGWVELYANGEVRSQNAFHKFENGAQGPDLAHDATAISNVKKVRLGTANGKLVNSLSLGSFEKKIGDYEVFENGEVFYRGMSQADYQYLVTNGKIRAPLNSPTSEVFTSPSLEYIKSVGYGGDGVIVKFNMKKGTLDNLVANGVRDQSNRAAALFPNMQSTNISGWEANGKVYFKQETIHNTSIKQVNIGLGKNTNGGLNLFNGQDGSNIIEFQIVQ